MGGKFEKGWRNIPNTWHCSQTHLGLGKIETAFFFVPINVHV